MSPDMMFNFNNGLILLICGLFSLIVPFGWAQQRNNKPDDFSCPEEFGYYPHPTDCTQYYVCVFGGALVESCTGGLMYSHDLQTCDWPRNVGCISSVSATASLNNANSVNTAPGNEELGLRQTTPSWKHEALQPQQDEIPDRHLYDEEDLGPVEEIESDRQQRVYRGQPPTLGQVARDRDGIVRHVNALQTSAGPEKVKPVAVLSYSPHHQSLRPPPSVPSYIIEQTSSSIPTTTKAVYNVTKFEPYYSVYDEDPQVYSDIEYGQYQSQRKLPSAYQVVQKSQHRLQPQQPQIVNNVPSYTNTDYRLQSNIDGDVSQTEKLPSTRLYVGNNHLGIPSTTSGNEKPVEFFVSHPNTHVTLPITGHTTLQTNRPSIHYYKSNDNNNRNSNSDSTLNRHLKISSFFNLANETYQPTTKSRPTEKPVTITRPSFETVKSYELTFLDHDDVVTGETLQLSKVTPYYHLRKFSQNFTNTSPTTNFIKSAPTSTSTFRPTTKLKASHTVTTNNDNDNFRIIVEPISVYKKLTVTGTTPTSSTKTTPALTSLKAFTNALLLNDKVSSASQYRSQPFSNFTYSPYTTIKTTTSTPTKLGSSSIVTENSDKSNRRFYIPRTDTGTQERKPQTFPITSTSSPSIPKTDRTFRTTNKIFSSSPKFVEVDGEEELDDEVEETEVDDTPRNSKAVASASLVNKNRGKTDNDTVKLYEDNEILYYDDYYDEAESEKTNHNDNYIDNKISEYTTPKSTVRHSLNSNNIPTKTATVSTAIYTPSKSSFSHKVPFEESTSSGVSKEADIGTSKCFKESSTQRCPQCNEKPLVRGRNRGSITYTTGGNEYDSVTSAGGRTRPTLKPSTSIVSKAAEAVDIYKNFPKRPDPVYPTPQVDKPAAKCRKDICLLPDCSCGGKDIPGELPLEDVPQLVLLTFDDSVNELNRQLYTDLFEKDRVNPNGCPISATFYVSHEWTDYSMVQNLYAAGHEIASHSVSHSFGEQFSQRKWTKEIVGQREILSAYGGVRQDDVRGMRAPFLAVGGNKMFKMLYDSNFTYDSSMPIYENRPPSWPYTLDYKLFHDCMIPPCPTRSYPGVWEVPMVMWQDLNGGRCSMGDACSNPTNADDVYKMLIKNFERHFSTNRAPFGLFYHSSWFTQPQHKEGFMTFLDTIMNMPEVWLVTNWQAIQWARDPTPISRLNQFTPFGCDFSDRPKRCNNPKVCNLWHKSGVRYLKTCQPCPDVYPWTGKTGVRNSRVDNDDTLTE